MITPGRGLHLHDIGAEPGFGLRLDLKLPRFRGVLASLVDYASVDWTSIACS
jgi:hypothetical protein